MKSLRTVLNMTFGGNKVLYQKNERYFGIGNNGGTNGLEGTILTQMSTLPFDPVASKLFG